MSSRFLLIASEFGLYRETLSGTLKILRPEIPVWTVSPSEADDIVHRNRPWLVICSNVTEMIEEMAPAWIELHPADTPFTTVSMAGERSTIAHPELTFDELLGIIDDMWKLQLDGI